jgi:hypothetical protein
MAAERSLRRAGRPGGVLARHVARLPLRVVGVAQLVELLVVVQAVVGSSPIAHPSEAIVVGGLDPGAANLFSPGSKFIREVDAFAAPR